MRPYSMDLRERVLEAVDEGKRTKWEISLLFKVSPAWIRRLLQRRRETGSIAPKRRDYSDSGKVNQEVRQRLAELVGTTPDATLQELHDRLGVSLSLSTICRTLAKMGLRFQIRRIGGQEPDLGSGLFDGRTDASGFVARQVVHDHDVPGLQLGNEHFIDKRGEREPHREDVGQGEGPAPLGSQAHQRNALG